MATLLAPARLPLEVVEEVLDTTSTTIQHSPDSPYYWRQDSFARRHGYLHSLALSGCTTTPYPKASYAEAKHATSPPFSSALSQPPHIVAKSRANRERHLRSLSESFISRARMAAAISTTAEDQLDTDTAPSSPPELSYSKSSKSSNSSLRSDSSDDDEPTATKLAHFEDITIEDVGRDSIEDSNLRPESRPTLKRPLPRSAITMDGTRRVSSPVTGVPPTRYPTLRGAEAPFNPRPNGLGLRRGFTSPSAPSLFTLDAAHRSSRSPSPTKPFMRNGISVSPQTLASATPKLSNEVRSPSTGSGLFARRKSWQVGGSRKTAKEREADYNDEDEEVPAEYILENVPITPMPGQPRLSQSLSRSQSRSATPSPQRRPSYTNLHSANVPKGAKRPSAPSPLPNGQYGIPRSPHGRRPNMLHHSMTMPNFHAGAMHRKERSKSWTDDLSEEAREISAALEAYADRKSSERQGSGANSPSNSSPEPLFLKERAKTSTFELPLAQKGNIMMDPLPISKEKEAVLTRTRPSWLPPKDQKEEKRHMKEWAQMMARAAEAEKRRTLKEKEAQESKEEIKDSIARIWEQHVLPNWELVVKEPRTRELWWRGVTPHSRGVVWQRAIGNDLELSESSFTAALNRASELEEKIAEMTPEERSKSKEAAWFDAIVRDVATACPQITATSERQSFERDLTNVLKASSMYRSDVGYVYGTHLIAGTLCLHLRASDAFVSLANLLNRPIPLAFHVHDAAAMSRAYNLVLSTLNYKFTKLHSHLTSPTTNVQPHEYLDPIFRSLFAYHLPHELVSRIWDIYVFEGDKVLIRAAVAVLGRLESKLYGDRESILDLLGWRNEGIWKVGSEEEFVAAVREAGKVDSKGEVKGA